LAIAKSASTQDKEEEIFFPTTVKLEQNKKQTKKNSNCC